MRKYSKNYTQTRSICTRESGTKPRQKHTSALKIKAVRVVVRGMDGNSEYFWLKCTYLHFNFLSSSLSSAAAEVVSMLVLPFFFFQALSQNILPIYFSLERKRYIGIKRRVSLSEISTPKMQSKVHSCIPSVLEARYILHFSTLHIYTIR